jgi:hypothetical protein
MTEITRSVDKAGLPYNESNALALALCSTKNEPPIRIAKSYLGLWVRGLDAQSLAFPGRNGGKHLPLGEKRP